jgi:predicted HAD superfamily Cof-like phosphohydrolase
MDMFNDVLEFHRKFGCCIGTTPAIPSSGTVDLRERIVAEEIDELYRAMCGNDLPGVADAIADAIYVLLGTAVSYGIDIRPVWEAVHASNMAKVGGAMRSDGKVMKPPGWMPPDVVGVLARQVPLAPAEVADCPAGPVRDVIEAVKAGEKAR